MYLLCVLFGFQMNRNKICRCSCRYLKIVQRSSLPILLSRSVACLYFNNFVVLTIGGHTSFAPTSADWL